MAIQAMIPSQEFWPCNLNLSAIIKDARIVHAVPFGRTGRWRELELPSNCLLRLQASARYYYGNTAQPYDRFPRLRVACVQSDEPPLNPTRAVATHLLIFFLVPCHLIVVRIQYIQHWQLRSMCYGRNWWKHKLSITLVDTIPWLLRYVKSIWMILHWKTLLWTTFYAKLYRIIVVNEWVQLAHRGMPVYYYHRLHTIT